MKDMKDTKEIKDFDKKRRTLVQTAWVAPIVSSVALPAHAQTTDEPVDPGPLPPEPTFAFAFATNIDPEDDLCSNTTPVFDSNLGVYTSTVTRSDLFELTNNSSIPVTIMTATGSISTIARTDATLATPIPVGGTAAFEATLVIEEVQAGSECTPNTVTQDDVVISFVETTEMVMETISFDRATQP